MLVTIKIKPNSRRAEIIKESNNIYIVRVDALPVDGAANKRLREILAEYFKVPKTNVIIKKGLKSRIKKVEINENNTKNK